MFKLKLLSIAAIFIMFVGVACGPSGPMGAEDRTAVTGVVLVEDTYERVADATVSMEDGELTATTNENGVFTIIGAPTGSQDVMVDSNMGSTTATVEINMNGSRIELFVN
ncbi:carboxypeptidase-like regulatory domain-containing protein [Rhodohalobacter sp. 8-1]|uniref:carboxypeptidase-like regulatory domain-containing protein n=1 Tax=Rhodohalobacter sp. 8-1 TaxID=3131972 RepID=UPI0030EF2222